jgi:hypothetical protein
MMAGELRDALNRLSVPPSKEEWELRKRGEIVQRWHRIAEDLKVLSVEGGILTPGQTIESAIAKLENLGIEDVR